MLLAAVLATALCGVFSTAATAATCTDEFTGPNDGQWSDLSYWSAGRPTLASVVCWPSNITVRVTLPFNGFGGEAGSIQGGGLEISGEDAVYFGNSAGVSTLTSLTQAVKGYMRGPQILEVDGPVQWSSGQEEHIELRQSADSTFSIEPGLYPDLDPGSIISTASPIKIENPDFEFGGGGSFVTTTSTITLAPGLRLYTGGGDDGTFTAAGIEPNSGPKYGLGGDSLVVTGGTTTVASGTTLETGPLTLEGGNLQDDGTVGQFTFEETTTPVPITLAGGTLSGTGTVAGSVTNTGGVLAPGDAPGQLTLAGEYTQESGGTLAIGIAGPTPGTEFDQLRVDGGASLAGALSVTDEGGYEPPLGQTFKIMSHASPPRGSFSSIGGPSADVYGVAYEPEGVSLTTDVAPIVHGVTMTGSTTTTTTTTVTPTTTTGIASSPKAIEELRLGCSNAQLVLNDVYIHGDRVLLGGSAAASLVGKKIKILFGPKNKQVATATVGTDGEFATTAPLPPAKLRDSVETRYTAAIGKLRSLGLKLTRRLLLEAPKATGTTVTLSGQVTLPLTKPIAAVIVEQQFECGRTSIAKTFIPASSGRFHITLTVPANAKAAIYRLKSDVAANAHSMKHGFATFSLPLPVALG